MPLRVAGGTAIRGGMKLRGPTAFLVLPLLLAACHKPAVVTVDETRPLTMADEGLKVDASNLDRFQDPKQFPFAAGIVPDGWRQEAADQFRLLNFSFGQGGEVAVGASRGDLLQNINRWMDQFSAPHLKEEDFGKLEIVHVLGTDGVWVEAKGTYAGGMGREPRTGQMLIGVVADDGKQIITVKMTGPADEVAAQKPALNAFIRGLHYR